VANSWQFKKRIAQPPQAGPSPDDVAVAPDVAPAANGMAPEDPDTQRAGDPVLGPVIALSAKKAFMTKRPWGMPTSRRSPSAATHAIAQAPAEDVPGLQAQVAQLAAELANAQDRITQLVGGHQQLVQDTQTGLDVINAKATQTQGELNKFANVFHSSLGNKYRPARAPAQQDPAPTQPSQADDSARSNVRMPTVEVMPPEDQTDEGQANDEPAVIKSSGDKFMSPEFAEGFSRLGGLDGEDDYDPFG
jgi:hypothetical protein